MARPRRPCDHDAPRSRKGCIVCARTLGAAYMREWRARRREERLASSVVPEPQPEPVLRAQGNGLLDYGRAESRTKGGVLGGGTNRTRYDLVRKPMDIWWHPGGGEDGKRLGRVIAIDGQRIQYRSDGGFLDHVSAIEGWTRLVPVETPTSPVVTLTDKEGVHRPRAVLAGV